MTDTMIVAIAGLLIILVPGGDQGIQSSLHVADRHVAAAPIAVPAGVQLDVHSGTLLAAGGYFYLYGEHYSCGFRWTDPTTSYCGAQVFRSADLVNWSGPWPILDPAVDWQAVCMGQPGSPGNGCFRPKVVWNPNTGRYVLWLNTPEAGEGYRVLTSSNPLGPFQEVGQPPQLGDLDVGDWQGKPTSSGDENLYAEAGTAWMVWNRGGTLLVEQLDSTFTTGAELPRVIRNYPEIAPFYGVESPAMFAHRGWYYISMSLPRCPYCTGTGTAILRAASPEGPWSYQGVVSADSCHGQPNGVALLPDGSLLWSSDQWVQGDNAGSWPKLNETLATQAWELLSFEGTRVAPISCAR